MHTPGDGSAQTVLVVEDDPAICALLKRALELTNIQCTLVRTREEAVRSVQERVPHLLLCDLRLEGADGLETISAVRDLPSGRNIPAILMTGLLEEDTAERVARLKVSYIIKKPFALPQLLAAVRTYSHDPQTF